MRTWVCLACLLARAAAVSKCTRDCELQCATPEWILVLTGIVVLPLLMLTTRTLILTLRATRRKIFTPTRSFHFCQFLFQLLNALVLLVWPRKTFAAALPGADPLQTLYVLASCLRLLGDWAFVTMMFAKLAIWLKIHMRSRVQRKRTKVCGVLRSTRLC